MLTRELKSLQHPIVKHLVRLRTNRKYRAEKNATLVIGNKLTRELPCTQIYTSDPEEKADIHVTPEIVKKITGLKHPQSLIAEVPLPKQSTLINLKKILVLDNIQDPGNLGNLLRTALALGIEGVLLLPGTADPFSDKALASAKGATFHLPLRQGTLEDLKQIIQTNNLIPFVADTHGAPMCTLSAPIALILGNEGSGPSPEVAALSRPITIPMAANSESLNVATAGAILMHHVSTL